MPALLGRIGGEAGQWFECPHGRCVDDGPGSLLDHLTHLVFETQEDAFEIDVQSAIPEVRGHIDDVGYRDPLAIGPDASIVEGKVQPAVPAHALLYQRLNIGLVGYVAFEV